MTDNTPKFTPGPWIITEARGFTSNRKLIQTKDGEDIAATCYHEPADTMANASLIAAAPEMYDALNGASAFLRAFADVLEETMKHDSRKEYAAAVLRVAVSMRKRADGIDALLRKARGEA